MIRGVASGLMAVNIAKAYKIDRGRLVCDVYFNGRNLADYFTEYQ